MNIILIILITYNAKAQHTPIKYSLFCGINYGGPIPLKINANSGGSPKNGLLFGMNVDFSFTRSLTLSVQLKYEYKGVNYNTKYRKDTLIAQEINHNIVNVQSFYNAYVNGNMGLNYLVLNISPGIKINQKLSINAGIYSAYLLTGYDEGNIKVVIGEGGFLGDYDENFNNINNITKFDIGVSAGFKFNIWKKLFTELKVNRSIRALYQDDFFAKRGLEQNKLYHTYLNVILGYQF